MNPQHDSPSSRLRASLSYPVVDADAHLQEFTNILREDILA
jgi:hypothetical protein